MSRSELESVSLSDTIRIRHVIRIRIHITDITGHITASGIVHMPIARTTGLTAEEFTRVTVAGVKSGNIFVSWRARPLASSFLFRVRQQAV